MDLIPQKDFIPGFHLTVFWGLYIYKAWSKENELGLSVSFIKDIDLIELGPIIFTSIDLN